eukprot:UN26022
MLLHVQMFVHVRLFHVCILCGLDVKVLRHLQTQSTQDKLYTNTCYIKDAMHPTNRALMFRENVLVIIEDFHIDPKEFFHQYLATDTILYIVVIFLFV